MAKKGFEDRGQGLGRREVLECMVWAGTGVLWGMSGGVPHSVGLIGEAAAAESTGFTFKDFQDHWQLYLTTINSSGLGPIFERTFPSPNDSGCAAPGAPWSPIDRQWKCSGLEMV